MVLGIWLFISAFVWPHFAASQTNTWIIGLLIVLVSALAVRNPNVRWGNTALSIWLVISTGWFWPITTATLWNNVIVGFLVFGFSLIGRLQPGRARRRRPPY
jgi:hypothetical protein